MLDYYRRLIADQTRTAAFTRALEAVIKPGQVVIDLGCGTGLLSLIACQLGASRVYAIERRHAADFAALLARDPLYADRIHVIHADSHEVQLPELGDVLVTETLGMLGLDEGIAGSVIDARRLLRPDATIIPRAVDVWLAPVQCPDLYETHVGWWSGRHAGIDWAPLQPYASRTIQPVTLPPDSLLAAPVIALHVDLTSITTPAIAGSATFTATRSGTLHGFAGWFDATLADGITLTNAPPSDASWSQALLPLETPIDGHEGAEVLVELSTFDGAQWRWRGAVDRKEFDQNTAFAAPPCTERSRSPKS